MPWISQETAALWRWTRPPFSEWAAAVSSRAIDVSHNASWSKWWGWNSREQIMLGRCWGEAFRIVWLDQDSIGEAAGAADQKHCCTWTFAASHSTNQCHYHWTQCCLLFQCQGMFNSNIFRQIEITKKLLFMYVLCCRSVEKQGSQLKI